MSINIHHYLTGNHQNCLINNSCYSPRCLSDSHIPGILYQLKGKLLVRMNLVYENNEVLCSLFPPNIESCTHLITCCLIESPLSLMGQFHRKNASRVPKLPGLSLGTREWSCPGMVNEISLFNKNLHTILFNPKSKGNPHTKKHV